MKIDSIQLENFGIYGSKRFNFDGQPLILIYGANESGKTTTLNGLRQALFGFPRNSAYITGKTMSADGSVTLSDGRQVRFHRQKKNSDAFRATVDNKLPLTESAWTELASGLDLKAYQSLFGFSLDELRSGEKALAHSAIDDALSSSGFGGLARLQQVQNRIEEFLNQSLKKTGIGGTINAKLAEIATAEKHLESVLTLPADVAALRERVSQAQSQVTLYQQQILELRSALQQVQRQQAALPRAVEYRQVQQSLSSLSIPHGLDHDFRMQWTVTANRLAGARSELNNELRKLEQLEGELASLPPAHGTGLFHEEVIQLGKLAREVPLWRQQVASDLRELSELENELTESLRKIGWSRQDTRWRALRLDLNQQAEIRGARQSLESLSGQLNECRTRIDVSQKQLHMHRRPSSTSNSTQTTTSIEQHLAATTCSNSQLSWDRIVEIESQLRSLRPLDHAVDQSQRRLLQAQRDRQATAQIEELVQLTARLGGASHSRGSGTAALSMDWSVPGVTKVNQQQSRLAAAAAEVQRCQREVNKRTEQLARLESELEQAQAQAGVKTLAELEAVWSQRDQIVSQWREELRTPLLASTVTPTEFDERLKQLQQVNQQSDEAVRAMLAAVEQVAKLSSRQRDADALCSSLAEATEQLNKAQQIQRELIAVWHELWTGCPLGPASPSAAAPVESPELYVRWLELYGVWRQHHSNLQQLTTECEQAAVARERAWQSLVMLWPSAGQCQSLAEAEQMIARERSAMATAEAQSKLLTELEQTVSQSLQERSQLEQQITAQQTEMQQTIVAVGLPESWTTGELQPRLDSLKQCQTLAQRIDKLRERQQTLDRQLHDFTQSVRELASRMSITLQGNAAEEYAATWFDQHTHGEQADHRRLELQKLIESQRAARDRRTEQVKQLEQTAALMMQSLQATSIEQVQTWINQSASLFQLQAREKELRAALETNANGRSIEEFLVELAELNPRSVTATTSMLTAQLSSLEATAGTAQQYLGGLARELEFKEQGSAALEAEQKLKRLRSELVELSEQWAVHRLAGELLERTIDRFTRNHEPQLIKHTRRFFKELTDDRYGVVEHDSGKHGGFAVRDQHGNAWQPDKLSTGTREQLYLAIRLAFITHFNETHEPLPVIMDDCFVNFDDTRARVALRTLIHWQESVQTIVLSCHWRSVEALADLAPETPVLTIGTGEILTARAMLDQHQLTGLADR